VTQRRFFLLQVSFLGLRLDSADVHHVADDAGVAALVGGYSGGDQGVAAGVDGGTAGQGKQGEGGAAVVFATGRVWGW
jgi:hypothetical protein